jgi:hypothetical protein
VERIWECKCGEIKAKLLDEPIMELRCHCHSCVAAAVSKGDRKRNPSITFLEVTHPVVFLLVFQTAIH